MPFKPEELENPGFAFYGVDGKHFENGLFENVPLKAICDYDFVSLSEFSSTTNPK